MPSSKPSRKAWWTLRSGEEPIEVLEDPGFLTTELANSVTHGIGLLLSVVGLLALVVFAALNGDDRHILACSIYGATLVLLYLTSTLFHTARAPGTRRVLRILDHSAIFLLIAGTYTPFTLVTLEGSWGRSIFVVIWGLALVGVVLKIFFTGRLEALSVLLYLAMGWMAVVATKPLVESLGPGGVAWLLAGGLAYTFGVVFYLWERVPHHHAIWHLFVMVGSTCHFFAVMLYVIPH